MEMPDATAPMESHWPLSPARTIELMVVLFGAFLRLWQFAINRSLWYDEAMLALSILEAPFSGVFRPISFNEAAPPVFVLIEKTLVVLLGNRDYVLRLFPLVAGLVSLPLMWRATRDLLREAPGLVALAFFAVSGSFIYYASDLKQYSSDGTTALLMVVLAHRCLHANPKPRGTLLLLGALGTLGTWISFPLLFVMCGVGLALSLDLWARRDRRGLRWLVPLALAWGAGLLANYLLLLRPLSRVAALSEYWGQAFMPVPPWRNPGWFGHAWQSLLSDPAGLRGGWLTSLVIVAGALSLFHRNWRSGLLLLVPFGAVLLASALHRYPFEGRLLLFAAPMLYLFAGAGIEWIWLSLDSLSERMSRGWARGGGDASSLWGARLRRWPAIAVAALLAAHLLYRPVVNAVLRVGDPIVIEETRPLLAHLAVHRGADEPLYVFYGANRAFRYYAPQYGQDRGPVVLGIWGRQDPKVLVNDLAQLQGRPRVWVLFSHNVHRGKVNEQALLLAYLDRIGSRLEKVEAVGAALYLYDLSGRKDEAPAGAPAEAP